jgi:DNA-binding response OmpR family regulator
VYIRPDLPNSAVTDRVLVVDDEPDITALVAYHLARKGYRVSTAANGSEALRRATNERPDLIVLDLMLPGRSGYDVLEELRRRPDTRDAGVILLTARREEGDRLKGLALGADDYVVKPFSVRELLARVEAVLRRSPDRPAEVAEWPLPGGVIDLRVREVRFDDGARSPLSEKEAELLRYLVRRAGEAVSRDELLARVWQMNPEAVDTRTVDMHVARLREKLRDDGQRPRIIVTLRGRGYMFQASPREPSR